MFHRLLGYQKNRLNLGLLVSNKTNQKGQDKEDETRLAGSSSESAFGSMQLEDKLKLEDKLTALVHIDRNFDPHAAGKEFRICRMRLLRRLTQLFGVD